MLSLIMSFGIVKWNDILISRNIITLKTSFQRTTFLEIHLTLYLPVNKLSAIFPENDIGFSITQTERHLAATD